MAEEQQPKPACKTGSGCDYKEYALNWLKVVDDWSIAGWKNPFPRLYYTVAALVILVFLL